MFNLLIPRALAQVAQAANEASSTLIRALQPAYVDKREDRVVVYINYIEEGVQEFTYKIKAVNQGRYVVPPPFAESMYDRSVKYLGTSQRIEVEAAARR